jgi:hypothetical protein
MLYRNSDGKNSNLFHLGTPNLFNLLIVGGRTVCNKLCIGQEQDAATHGLDDKLRAAADSQSSGFDVIACLRVGAPALYYTHALCAHQHNRESKHLCCARQAKYNAVTHLGLGDKLRAAKNTSSQLSPVLLRPLVRTPEFSSDYRCISRC